MESWVFIILGFLLPFLLLYLIINRVNAKARVRPHSKKESASAGSESKTSDTSEVTKSAAETTTAKVEKTRVRWWSGKKLFSWKPLLAVLLALIVALIIYALLVWVSLLELPGPSRPLSWTVVSDYINSGIAWVGRWLPYIAAVLLFLLLLYILPWKGRLIALAILAVIVLGKNGAFQGNGTLPTAGSPELAVASRSVCDGRVHQGVPVTRAGRKVNDNCSFTFEVTSGCMYFDGPHGRTETWCKGMPPKPGQRKQIITAVAVTPDARLDYVLCPINSPMNGWSCQ